MPNNQKDMADFLDLDTRKRLKDSKDLRTPPASREELIGRLMSLKELGWLQTRHQVNDGLVGNTLEDYLEVQLL